MQKVDFSLSVMILKEGESFIAYAPALDISTVGDTLAEAQQRFDEAVHIFLEEIKEEGTVDDALSELGWPKVNHEYVPPVVVGHDTQTFSVSYPA